MYQRNGNRRFKKTRFEVEQCIVNGAAVAMVAGT